MELLGMLDSPFVRRVAIALRLHGLPFAHRNLSVFRHYDELRRVNPAAKVPTLVDDDGTVLMESGLILDLLDRVAGRSLWPQALEERRRALRVAGLALVACEKAVQLIVECQVRPQPLQYEALARRVREQLAGALGELDAALAAHRLPLEEAQLGHAAIAAAVAWRFVQIKLPQDLPHHCPALADLSARAEQLPVFAAVPPDETVRL